MSDINANPFKSYNFFKEMDCNSVHKLKNWASAKIAVKYYSIAFSTLPGVAGGLAMELAERQRSRLRSSPAMANSVKDYNKFYFSARKLMLQVTIPEIILTPNPKYATIVDNLYRFVF